MEELRVTDKGKVFMTCVIDEVFTWENISPQHIVAYIYSGELDLSYGKDRLTFVAGDTVLVHKNQLSRSVKKPLEGEPFKCLSMLLPEKQLREFYQNHPILESWTENISKQRPIKSHPLLKSFFRSLLPYFEMQDELPDEIVSFKIQEVLTIIDSVDKRASSILGTFSEIGKIDLEKYMEEHYMYNLPLERFAFLTGRSLTTFKSDFKKIFKKTPGKWLTEKRLNLAHHKLTAEKQKITDVYHSVGFENLSHFSFAFKKAFGYSPSTVRGNQL
ncbi:MAG: AraC family transcriptional regulator [Bacteroidota bacterium]